MHPRPSIIALLLLTHAVPCQAEPPADPWRYGGEFHQIVAAADRIVIHPDGVKDDRPIDGETVLFQVTNDAQVRVVSKHIAFESPQQRDSCFCYGNPTIVWYQGDKQLACASLKHGEKLYWAGFPGDVQLAKESADWIVDWLSKHGVPGPKQQLEMMRKGRAVAAEAQPILNIFTPAGLTDAINRAEQEADALADENGGEDYESQRESLLDRYIRNAFKEQGEMYTALFRLLGCLPMSYAARYLPEQDEAYEFLARAPRDELDQAFRSAALSEDRTEKQGAARLLFSQRFMTNHEKSEGDIVRWMELFTDTAYADPFPENRREVLQRLTETTSVPATDVLEAAVSDPDQTVRRLAIEALRNRGGPQTITILGSVADGSIEPRESPELPTDFGEGAVMLFGTPIPAGKYRNSDREAAIEALKHLGE